MPELILLDIMLPGDDGYTILEQLKSMPSVKEVPVIMETHREVLLAVDLSEHRAILLAAVSMARTVMAMVIMNIILRMAKIWMIS